MYLHTHIITRTHHIYHYCTHTGCSLVLRGAGDRRVPVTFVFVLRCNAFVDVGVVKMTNLRTPPVPIHVPKANKEPVVVSDMDAGPAGSF